MTSLVWFQKHPKVVTITGYQDVPVNSEYSLLKAIARQPVSVAIEASGLDFQFYKGVSISHLLLFFFHYYEKPTCWKITYGHSLVDIEVQRKGIPTITFI